MDCHGVRLTPCWQFALISDQILLRRLLLRPCMSLFSFLIPRLRTFAQMKPGVFREEYIAIIVRELLRGLEYLHSEGKLHRDIKGI